MTLDEAIKHAEEIAEEQEGRGYCDRSVCVIMDENNHNCDECEVVKCRECAKEHRQLAEWLKDYKRLLEQEPCGDCISRQSVYEIINDAYFLKLDDGAALQESVRQLPTVTPAPKIGHWIKCIDDNGSSYYRCSACRCGEDFKFDWCPNCGAKMEVISNETDY